MTTQDKTAMTLKQLQNIIEQRKQVEKVFKDAGEVGIIDINGSSSNRIIRFSGDNSGFSGLFQVNAGARAVLLSGASGSAAADFVVYNDALTLSDLQTKARQVAAGFGL